MTMRHALPALLLLAACGGSSPPPQQPKPDAPDNTLAGAEPAAGGGVAHQEAQRVCNAIAAMTEEGCGFLQGYDTAVEACVEDLVAAEGDPLVTAIAGCFATGATCASAETCVNEAIIANAPPRDPPTGPKLSQTPSSKAAPIEVCMPGGEMEWIFNAQCDDGTNPFATLDAAYEARAGSVGAGGRNGNVLDLYEVRCPEKTYEVFMDMYAAC